MEWETLWEVRSGEGAQAGDPEEEEGTPSLVLLQLKLFKT